MTDHTHRWRFVRDWYGDKSIPNGTVDCSHWECADPKCGETTEEQPDDWEDPEALRADEERDRDK